jgi:hypothetical protein
MDTDRKWGQELKWWLSSFAALLAALMIFSLIKAVFSLAAVSVSDLALAGITDPYGGAIGDAVVWSYSAILVYWAFLLAAALSFRLLVPTFAGVEPRKVAVVVTTLPIALGAQLVGQDLPNTIFFAGVGVLWALAMPMPKKTLLSDDPLLGGAIIGLAFGALAGLVLMEFAIAWCAIRLLRGKTIEVTAAAICAAMMPALFIATQLPHASLSANAIYVMVEVLILGVLALVGFVRAMFVVDDDPEDEGTEDAEAVEATQG